MVKDRGQNTTAKRARSDGASSSGCGWLAPKAARPSSSCPPARNTALRCGLRAAMSGARPTSKRKRGEACGSAAALQSAAAEPAPPPPNELDADPLDAVLALLHADFQCAICQGLVVAPHLVSCSHRFCGACIHKWAARENTCPTCRAVMQGPPVFERGVVRWQRSCRQRLRALTRPSSFLRTS